MTQAPLLSSPVFHILVNMYQFLSSAAKRYYNTPLVGEFGYTSAIGSEQLGKSSVQRKGPQCPSPRCDTVNSYDRTL